MNKLAFIFALTVFGLSTSSALADNCGDCANACTKDQQTGKPSVTGKAISTGYCFETRSNDKYQKNAYFYPTKGAKLKIGPGTPIATHDNKAVTIKVTNVDPSVWTKLAPMKQVKCPAMCKVTTVSGEIVQ